MRNLRQQLPPLTALVVFEAAARHLSFTRAALELSISQAAVSRQIRRLENNLGVSLFQRLHRTIALTDDGRKLLRTVTISLKYLADTVTELRGSATNNTVIVITTHAVASFWLIPRLAKFRARFPDIEVQVVATDQEIEQINESFDIAIRYGAGAWPGAKTHFLGQPEIFPVCSPEYLKNHAITDLDALFDATLLYQDDLRWDWIDWPIWLAELGISEKKPSHKIKINSYPLLIQAALAGQGIALGWDYLVDHLLVDGSLVKPIDTALLARHSFYLVMPEAKPMSSQVEQFSDWISAEFAQ